MTDADLLAWLAGGTPAGTDRVIVSLDRGRESPVVI